MPYFSFGQSTKLPWEANEAKLYAQAITDFIKCLRSETKYKCDTLFVLKRKNAQVDDFPDIELPEVIENTPIRIIEPDRATGRQNENRSLLFINLIGQIDGSSAEFIFVVFYEGFVHQFDFYSSYSINDRLHLFQMHKHHFKDPPFSR